MSVQRVRPDQIHRSSGVPPLGEADVLLQRSLTVQVSAGTLDRAATARQRLGYPNEALTFFNQAL
jgi:hypothetical protein